MTWSERLKGAWRALRGVKPVRGLRIEPRPGKEGEARFSLEWCVVSTSTVALIEIPAGAQFGIANTDLIDDEPVSNLPPMGHPENPRGVGTK